jgi:hypothetical protein
VVASEALLVLVWQRLVSRHGHPAEPALPRKADPHPGGRRFRHHHPAVRIVTPECDAVSLEPWSR